MSIPNREPTWVDDHKVTYNCRFSYWAAAGEEAVHNFQREVWYESSGQWVQQQTMYCRDGVAAREEVQRHLKFLTDFWTEYILDRHDARNVRAHGVHYQIGSESTTFKAFAGRKWLITWTTDVTRPPTTSTNLWSQGEIPPCFRISLPDNATLESC